MAKDYVVLGTKIVEKLGGAENITKIFHCSTRLRIQLANREKADLEAVKSVAGVMGAVEAAGGVQVIIGNDVPKVYEAVTAKYNLEKSEAIKEKLDDPEEKKGIVAAILNVLAAIIGPAIPLIMCSGLISALLVIMVHLGLDTESSTYAIINMVGSGALYFLPVLLSYTAAKKFNCDVIISTFLGALLISPTLLGFAEAGGYISLFGLPVKAVNYSSTVIPVILTIWVFSYVQKLVERVVPAAVKYIFRPLLCLVIMIPVMLCVTGPVGSYCGDLLSMLMGGINNTAPWASVLVTGCLAPLLVLTGMHLAMIPLVMGIFATAGFDNMMFPAFIGMNFSQFGIALACMLKTKNKNLRTLASSCALTSFLAGVTEPALYGICIRMKRPLAATWIACIVNAVFCAIAGIKVYSFGAPSFFTMPIFMNPDGTMGNFYMAIVAAGLTIVTAFAATWILGFDDSVYGEENE